MTERDAQDEGEELDALEDWCTEFCSGSDVPALLRFLTTREGQFHRIAPLVHPLDNAHTQSLAALERTHRAHVEAMWKEVPSPKGGSGAGWCAVVFYIPEHNALAQSALVNRDFLLQRHAH